MWFRYDDQNPLNFAWRWRQWEEAHPCPASERARTWPAFSRRQVTVDLSQAAKRTAC